MFPEVPAGGVVIPSKILVVGAPNVGKTSLLRYLFGIASSPTDPRQPTLGADFYSGRLPVRTASVPVQVWDTAGMSTGDARTGAGALGDCLFDHVDGAAVVYDATSRRSFECAAGWYEELCARRRRRRADGGGGGCDRGFPILVVANKLDALAAAAAVPLSVASAVARWRVIFGVDGGYGGVRGRRDARRVHAWGLKTATIGRLNNALYLSPSPQKNVKYKLSFSPKNRRRGAGLRGTTCPGQRRGGGASPAVPGMGFRHHRYWGRRGVGFVGSREY